MKLNRFNKTTYIFMFVLGLLIVGSFITFKQYNVLPVNLILDVLILSILIINSNKINNEMFYIFLSILSFIIFSFIYNVFYINTNVMDYFIANKSIFYLAVFCLFVGKNIFNVDFLYSFFKFILIVFLIKYILWLLFGPFNRPGVFFENNFELPLLLLIYLTLINYEVKVDLKYVAVMFFVFLLSGSLSGFLSLAAMFLILNLSKVDKYIILKIISLSIILLFLMFVINSRVTNIEALDRFVFLQELIYNIKSENLINLLIGNIGLHPLKQDTCNMLSFYSSLFSHNNDGTCYSVILHSYILRIIYDHGFLGLITIFSILLVILNRASISVKVILSVMAVIAINSLSVSGVSNTFIAVGVILLITSYRKKSVINE